MNRMRWTVGSLLLLFLTLGSASNSFAATYQCWLDPVGSLLLVR